MSTRSPVRLARAASSVRTAPQSLAQRMAPPQVQLLRFASGSLTTRIVFAGGTARARRRPRRGPPTAREVAGRADPDRASTHHLLPDTKQDLCERGVLDRCRPRSGSYLETAPDDDLYRVRRAAVRAHDDEQATTLLSTRVIPPLSTISLIEAVPEDTS